MTVAYKLGQDQILTDGTGIRQLVAFRESCMAHEDCNIHVSLVDLGWIDGNMCAVLAAIMYKLIQERGLRFSFDSDEVRLKFNNILFRNGFLDVEIRGPAHKSEETVMPFKAFDPNNKDGYINYLYNELLKHPGMPDFSDDTLGMLVGDLSELLSNIQLHAHTKDPFFVCGQYFPTQKKIKFTVTDLGVGFLPNVLKHTKGKIQSAEDAVLWAVEGNTTKTDAPGGINLRRMKDYLTANGGEMHIITGDAYWNSANLGTVMYHNGIMKLPHEIFGTIIHLVFNKKALT